MDFYQPSALRRTRGLGEGWIVHLLQGKGLSLLSHAQNKTLGYLAHKTWICKSEQIMGARHQTTGLTVLYPSCKKAHVPLNVLWAKSPQELYPGHELVPDLRNRHTFGVGQGYECSLGGLLWNLNQAQNLNFG